jgi:hypothetical protein
MVWIGKMKKAYKIMVGKPEQKRLVGIPINPWKDNIKTHSKERRCEDMEWVCLAQDTVHW